MKRLFSLLFLFAFSFSVIAAQDSKPIPLDDVKQKVVEVDSVLYLQTTTIHHEPLQSAVLQQFDNYEQSIANLDRQKQEVLQQRIEYAKLLKQAIRSGYQPHNKSERGQYLRIKEMIEKEKL